MNIAMISYHTCPLATLGGKDTGGMNVYVQELTRHLGQLGIHVDVFTRSQDEHVPHVLHNLGYGNRVVHIPAGPEHPLPKSELANHIPQFVEGILHFSAEKGIHYDLVHSHYWMSGVAAAELRKEWNSPIVHMFHTLGEMKNRIARSPSETEGEYRIRGEKRVLREADRIIVATEAERSQLEFLYHANSRKLVTIPPGVDTSRFYPIDVDEAKAVIDLPPSSRMLLYVGRIEPLKGVDTLIRAIAKLKHNGTMNRCPRELVIIGGDPDVEPEHMTEEMRRLQALCTELGIKDLVLFLGKRSQETLPYYYSAAEVVVVPSHYESFGMVALEAMACGTPVVASQVGGLAFLVQDGVTGFVIPDGDADTLAERLDHLSCNTDLRKQFSTQAATYARDYSWDLITPKIVDVYQALLNAYPPHE